MDVRLDADHYFPLHFAFLTFPGFFIAELNATICSQSMAPFTVTIQR
jgi:hypothetical protein